MTRAELMHRMSARELSEWVAYDRIEPLPDPWTQTGLLAALVHNAWFQGSARRPESFIPARPDPRPQSPEQAMAAMSAFAAGMARHLDHDE